MFCSVGDVLSNYSLPCCCERNIVCFIVHFCFFSHYHFQCVKRKYYLSKSKSCVILNTGRLKQTARFAKNYVTTGNLWLWRLATFGLSPRIVSFVFLSPFNSKVILFKFQCFYVQMRGYVMSARLVI